MKGVLTLEIEKLQTVQVGSEKLLDNRTINYEGNQSSVADRSSYRIDQFQNAYLESQSSSRKEMERNGSMTGFSDTATNNVCILYNDIL